MAETGVVMRGMVPGWGHEGGRDSVTGSVPGWGRGGGRDWSGDGRMVPGWGHGGGRDGGGRDKGGKADTVPG